MSVWTEEVLILRLLSTQSGEREKHTRDMQEAKGEAKV